jgi:hypothetical protein
MEVEKSDVGQGLGKFLKRGVDVFDLFDGEEEKLKSAKSSPLKKEEEQSPRPAANKAMMTMMMMNASSHDVNKEDAITTTTTTTTTISAAPDKKNKNNFVIVPIAPAPPKEGGEKKNIRPKETLEEKRKREELYNAQLESGIDEETFRSLPPDIQQELRKNKKTKFIDAEAGKGGGFSKAATIPSKNIASFFNKKKKK